MKIGSNKDFTYSQALNFFKDSLHKPNNYIRIVGRYLEYCMEKDFLIDEFSFYQYTKGKKANRASPIKKFLDFATMHGIAKVKADPIIEKKIHPVAACIPIFITHMNKELAEESKKNYLVGLNSFFSYAQNQLEKNSIKNFVQRLEAEGKSASTINFYLSAIQRFTLWLHSERDHPNVKLKPEEWQALWEIETIERFPVKEPILKDYLLESECDLLISKITSVREKALIALMVYCGLQTVELQRLELGDIDLEGQRLLISSKDKTSKQEIKLISASVEILQSYFFTISDTKGETKLFPFNNRQIRYVVTKYLKQSGLQKKGISARSLRLTSAYSLLQNGVSPVMVQRQLQHIKLETLLLDSLEDREEKYLAAMSKLDKNPLK